MKKITFLSGLMILVLSLPSFSEGFTKGKIQLPFTPSVNIKSKILKPKDKSEIQISFKLEEGSYLYKDSLSVDFAKSEGLKALSPLYPKSEKKFDTFAKHDKEIYAKDFSIKVPIELLSSAKIGKNELKVTIGYQGCSLKRGICFLPQKKELSIPIEIKK